MSRIRCVSVLLALAMVACGKGDGDNAGPDDDNYSIVISTSTSALSMPVGGSASLTVSVVRGGGYTGTVSLEVQGLPAYMTATLSPPTLVGTASTSTLTLTANSELATGSYSFVIRASGPDVDWAFTQPITCTVTEPPGFTLTIPNPSLSVIQGQSGGATVAIARTGGWTGSVTLATEGAPVGVTAAFTPNPATGTESALTLSVAATVAPGTFPLVVKGTGTGVAAQTAALTLVVVDASIAGFTLTVAPEVLEVKQGESVSATVTIHRTGGFSGAVSFFPEGHPAGVTATFEPGTTTGTTSTLTIHVASTVTPERHPITVRGEATGLPAQRVNLTFTVTEAPGFDITASPLAVTVSPGTAAQVVQVSIQRTGGFTGEVALAISGLPAFVTAAFNPAATTGTTSSLSLGAETGATAGNYTGTIRATSSGFPEQTVQVGVTVVISGTSIVWRFCGDNPAPVFLAYQDGSSPFAAVTPAGDGSYTTTLASARGAVVIVQPGVPEPPTSLRTLRKAAGSRALRLAQQAGYTTQLRYASTDELQAMAAEQCLGPFATKTVHGSVANVPAGNFYLVALAGGIVVGLPDAPSTFTLEGVLDGARDLVAGHAAQVGDGAEPRRFIIRRDQNPAAGSTIPVLDFAGTEGFDPASAGLTLAGLPAGALNEVTLGFMTGNGTVNLTGVLAELAATSRTWMGIPSARLRAGDLHTIIAESNMSSATREVTLYSREVVPRSIMFAEELPPPAVTVYATTPVYRLRASGTFGSTGSAFGGIAEATFLQSDRAWIVSQTRAWTGTSANFDLRTAVLTGVAGWNESLYGVKGASLVTWELSCAGSAAFVPADGLTLQRLMFRGDLMP